MSTYTFWGETCHTSAEPSGALGVILNGRRLPSNTYAAGQRILEAGDEGLPVDRVMRSDIDTLELAGAKVRYSAYGGRVHVDHLPVPTGFVQRVAKPEPRKTGQYGAQRHEPFSSRVNPDHVKPKPWR